MKRSEKATSQQAGNRVEDTHVRIDIDDFAIALVLELESRFVVRLDLEVRRVIRR